MNKTPTKAQLLKVLDGDLSKRNAAKVLGVGEVRLEKLAKSIGYDMKERSKRVRQAGFKRQSEAIARTNRSKQSIDKWAKAENTLCGVTSLMWLRRAWV